MIPTARSVATARFRVPHTGSSVSFAMPALRRTIAALSGALLLQLSLLASGTLCTMHGAASARPSAHDMHAMHSMDAGVAPGMAPGMISADAAAPAGDSSQGCDASSRTDGCRLPWAPGQCTSMTTCATPATPSAAVVAQVVSVRGESNLPEPRAIHSGPVAAPELPPPRA